MGILRRVLVPKPVKKATRSVTKATHPVRTARQAVTPKPVKQVARAAHPLEAAERGVENAVVRGLRGKPGADVKPPGGKPTGPAGQTVPSRARPLVVDLNKLPPGVIFESYEAERHQQNAEARAATSPEAQYEALVMANWLFDQQLDLLPEIIGSLSEFVRPPEQAAYAQHLEDWMNHSKAEQYPLMDQQNELLAGLGSGTCAPIGERASLRLSAIRQQAVVDLENRAAERR